MDSERLLVPYHVLLDMIMVPELRDVDDANEGLNFQF